jgi:prepilin-type N-terminal cleavage/methylation domain-containing protein
MTLRRRSTPVRPDHGFTLVEIMVVVVIVGILAAIAIPTFGHFRRNAKNDRYIHDVHVFAQAFETYAMKNGRWPPGASDGAVPTGMSGELRDQDWAAVNALGGRWNWDYKSGGITAGISVTGATVDDAQLIEIDKQMDDGNLSSGNLIKNGARLTYILQK